MLTVYLACLIFGGALLAVSVAAGGDAHGSTVVHVDTQTGAGVEGGISGGAEAHLELVDQDGSANGRTPHQDFAEAAQFLSLRNVVFFMAFFGATGTTLTLLGVTALLTVASSVGMGSTAAAAIHRVLGYLRRTESGRVDHERDFEGLPARVLVAVGPGKMGKVGVDTAERSVRLLAHVAEESAQERFTEGEEVVVVRVEDGVAQICGKDFIE